VKRVGIIGWRGMVGSVLLNRMIEEEDLSAFEPVFFSTSQAGQPAPDIGLDLPPLADAYNQEKLRELDIIITCQGGNYTKRVYPELRKVGWQGYWIDAASTLRMEDDSIIILDPVNRNVIDAGLTSGIKDFIGGNCTVSLMLMALGALFKADLMEWLTSMTYQAASGAGAKNMKELVVQMSSIADCSADLARDPGSSVLELDQQVNECLRADSFPADQFGAPLAGSLIPWIDRLMENGETREEWKGYVEANKILGRTELIPIDGICVRIGAMRSHSQAFTIKLRQAVPLDELTDMIGRDNEWIKIVENTKEATLKELSPAAVSGTLTIPVGRLRKMNLGPEYLTAFSVGDQLLWGAAEPLHRMLRILLEYLDK
jgi:aspartate-semialdehyde dehydrogenase